MCLLRYMLSDITHSQYKFNTALSYGRGNIILFLSISVFIFIHTMSVKLNLDYYSTVNLKQKIIFIL